MTTTTNHDVIILGAGAAGLSAGLVLARAQADVLLIDSGAPRNAAAADVHGFLSRDGMPPAELAALARREVGAAGGVLRAGEVTEVAGSADRGFAVTMADGSVERGRALLFATGLSDELPELEGLRERWGTLVHHCPYCHGYEVCGQAIAVIGGPARAMSIKQAGLLRRYSERVALISNGIELTEPERHRLEAFGVHLVTGIASGLRGEPGELDAVLLEDGRTIACDAAFIAPRPRPHDALLRSLGCATEQGSGLVAVDASGQSSVPGVWAAGNVVTPGAQVITAAGAGSASAIAINGWLLEKDLDLASAG
ncbi:NAD(P)/FAD-dependent oxidoreductase [Microterricola viridarii]|uniref:Thioredoxin reductase n=1 Tax=Microterricola viridarii TaxID=412690 RepID=A0A1H1MTD5_9MICO|nr:NAD(P)/FAD-dependent oxidoreductase [Microterricola viridarii]SDR89950.1 Thioredoxin reductase [Microterricola viridarii]